MKVQGTHIFRASQETLWALLMDPVSMARCIPGCERLEEKGKDRYEATLKVGVGSVKGTYKGRVELSDKDPPRAYRLTVEGSGAPGFVRGEARLTLEGRGEETALSLDAEAQVGGLVAGVGQRMLGGVAKLLMNQFFHQVEKELKGMGREASRL